MTIKKAVKLKLEHLAKIEPMTDTQRDVFQQYKNGYNLVLNGSAGTGKTFIAMALALEEALDRETHTRRLSLYGQLYLQEILVSYQETRKRRRMYTQHLTVLYAKRFFLVMVIHGNGW